MQYMHAKIFSIQMLYTFQSNCAKGLHFSAFHFKCFSFLFWYFFVIKFYVLNNFFAQYKHTYGRLWASHGVPRQPYEGLHIMFYTRRSKHKRTLHILRWTSAVCLQGAWCRSRSRGCALYRDASRAAYVLGPPPSRGGETSN